MKSTTTLNNTYGQPPIGLGKVDINLTEMMRYLYLPITMDWNHRDVRLPENLKSVLPLVRNFNPYGYKYTYLSAVRGVATPGNSLNRPGWHCDGFGTNDINVIWWKGPGTRFAIQPFSNISDNDLESLDQFEAQVDPDKVVRFEEGRAYLISPYVVHAVPVIERNCERQFVKLSYSNEKYNLEGNSHNYLFDYKWDMVDRIEARNVTNKDFVKTS